MYVNLPSPSVPFLPALPCPDPRRPLPSSLPLSPPSLPSFPPYFHIVQGSIRPGYDARVIASRNLPPLTITSLIHALDGDHEQLAQYGDGLRK